MKMKQKHIHRLYKRLRFLMVQNVLLLLLLIFFFFILNLIDTLWLDEWHTELRKSNIQKIILWANTFWNVVETRSGDALNFFRHFIKFINCVPIIVNFDCYNVDVDHFLFLLILVRCWFFSFFCWLISRVRTHTHTTNSHMRHGQSEKLAFVTFQHRTSSCVLSTATDAPLLSFSHSVYILFANLLQLWI